MLSYNFTLGGTGGTAALGQLPQRITEALAALQSDPTATPTDADKVMAAGQYLNYLLGTVGEECILQVNVSRNVMPNGEVTTAISVREQPFNLPASSKVQPWTPARGPLTMAAAPTDTTATATTDTAAPAAATTAKPAAAATRAAP